MTYPPQYPPAQQPQYPANPYAPQAYPPAAPAANPYAMPPQQPAAPVPAPMNLPTATADPAPPGASGMAPRIRDLEGRLVAILPTRLDLNQPGPKPESPLQDRLTLTVVVLDGGPLYFGGRPELRKPHDKVVPAVPARFDGVLSSHKNIVNACREHVGRSWVLGRIQAGYTASSENNPPWNLVRLEPNDPGRQSFAMFLGALQAGTFVNPPVQPLAPQAAMPTQPPYYGPPSAPPQYAPMPQPPAQYAPDPGAQQAYVTAGQAAPGAPGPAAVPPALAPAGPPPGSNIPPEVWATLTHEQRLGLLGPAAAPPVPQPPAPAPANPF